MSYAAAEYMQLSADPAPVAAPAQPTAKQAAAAKAAQPVAEATQPANKDASHAADELEAKAAHIAKRNEVDMRSVAATWAGHGTPPPLTAGDIATMTAPRPGFDPSLNPNGTAVESENTVNTAAREKAL